PKLHAFISEALRWRPVVIFGVFHRATEDIIWFSALTLEPTSTHRVISRDPVAFPDRKKFGPQRWLDPNSQLRTDALFYRYGFSRRVYPGLHVASRSLYINFVLLLWSFRIAERPNAPIDVDAFTNTGIPHALPFEVDFVPRMEEGLKQMMK
ncbi:cytochrome P450, partial [Melanogaster broomeanus]